MCKRSKHFAEGKGYTCEASEFSGDCPYQKECKFYQDKVLNHPWRPDVDYQAKYAYASGYPD